MTRSRLSVMWVAFLAVVALSQAGCGSIDLSRIRPREFQESRSVPGESRVVHGACRAALKGMNFNFDHGSAGTGRLEMSARILPGSEAQPLLQRTVVIQVSAGTESCTVDVGFWEISEDYHTNESSVSGGRLIRGGPLYEAFWQHLDEQLDKAGVKRLDEGPTTPAPAAP